MTPSPTMRVFLCLLAAASGVVAVVRLAESFVREELYKKDFVQEYVLAKAVAAGGEPYRPMKEMAARWIGPATVVNWPHPTPHTPVTAVLSVPFAGVDYPLAATLWLLLETSLLVLTWGLLFRWWGEAVPWPTRVVLVLLSLSLGPVIQELWFGNLSLVLLAILAAAWLALRGGRDVVGGAWIGLAIAVKLTAWPVVLFLLLKGRWRAVAAAGVVLGGLHLLALGVLGYGPIADYYSRVGPEISRGYRQHDSNYSLWTVGSRVFGEPSESVYNNFVALAPWTSPTVERAMRVAVPCLGLLAGLALALRCRDFDSSFGVLLCVSLVVNPVAWDHSLLVAAIPIAIAGKRLSRLDFPKFETTLAVVCFAMTMFPQRSYLKAVAFSTSTEEAQATFVPFWAGLVTYVPLVALIGWIVVLRRLDSQDAVGPSLGQE